MNTIDALYLIKYNPFKYSNYIFSFYNHLKIKENNLLFLPLIVPLCTHPILSYKIEKSNKRSSIYTVFFNNHKELHDLQDRINHFRILSLNSLEYCLINEWLEISNKNLCCYRATESNAVKNVKIAEKLSNLFNPYSIFEIYTILGVKP